MKILKGLIKRAANQTLKPFNVCIMNLSYLQRMEDNLQRMEDKAASNRAFEDLELLMELPERHSSQLLHTLHRSQSELRQDLVVLSELDFKRNGFFVEFGAANGIEWSNSYLLEKDFGWCGILAEPAKCWHKDLRRNRNGHIETDCVWRDSKSTLTFNEAEIGNYSTIDTYSSSELRKHGRTYEVKTISLEDLLDKYNAPATIDYLSIDTEGSEYEILSNFNFDKYHFKIITCEHNFRPVDRERIYALLTGKGYVRKFEKHSHFDDWYIRAE